MEILRVENLVTQFKLTNPDRLLNAVDHVNFSINEGETLGLVGESGCGKTTTALSLMKLLPKNGSVASGKIDFMGKDIAQMSNEEIRKIRWKEISIIFQGAMNALNPVVSVGEQIKEAIVMHENIEDSAAKRRVKDLLERVEIDSKRVLQYPHEFSGGMRQRVMIAMALASNPRLVIGDEPTTALDVMVQSQIFELLERLRKEMNMAMILITHDLSVLGDLCDRAAVMYAGKIVEIGTVEELYYNAKHPYTIKLMSSFPDINKPPQLPNSIKGTPPRLTDMPKGCRFHPRCDQAMPICKDVEPLEIQLSATHRFSCHLGVTTL